MTTKANAPDNMRIWDKVCTTDPAFTKKVNVGRKYTAIDAMWQIKQATQVFGPIGEGWSYKAEHHVVHLNEEHVLAVCDVTIYWDQTRSFGPVRGINVLLKPTAKGPHIDEDAAKKAMTDALTKGLSQLGFSADVFLGYFDDNHYVAEMERAYSEKPPSANRQPPADSTQDAPHPEALRMAIQYIGEMKGYIAAKDEAGFNALSKHLGEADWDPRKLMWKELNNDEKAQVLAWKKAQA